MMLNQTLITLVLFTLIFSYFSMVFFWVLLCFLTLASVVYISSGLGVELELQL